MIKYPYYIVPLVTVASLCSLLSISVFEGRQEKCEGNDRSYREITLVFLWCEQEAIWPPPFPARAFFKQIPLKKEKCHPPVEGLYWPALFLVPPRQDINRAMLMAEVLSHLSLGFTLLRRAHSHVCFPVFYEVCLLLLYKVGPTFKSVLLDNEATYYEGGVPGGRGVLNLQSAIFSELELE